MLYPTIRGSRVKKHFRETSTGRGTELSSDVLMLQVPATERPAGSEGKNFARNSHGRPEYRCGNRTDRVNAAFKMRGGRASLNNANNAIVKIKTNTVRVSQCTVSSIGVTKSSDQEQAEWSANVSVFPKRGPPVFTTSELTFEARDVQCGEHWVCVMSF